MSRFAWLVLCAAAIPPAHAQEKELLYEAPSELSISQLQQAAKSLAARCQACGLKGVTAVTDTRGMKRVRVSSPSGFQGPEPDRVDFFASFPASRIQLRIFHKLTAEESEKFPPGGKAPPGDSWVDMTDWERSETPFDCYRRSEKVQPWLFRTQPVLDVSAKLKVRRHEGGKLYGRELDAGLYLEFPRDITKPLYEAIVDNPDKPGKQALFIEILIDGSLMPTGGGMMSWADTAEKPGKIPDIALWQIKELSDSRILPALLQHRLPAALKRVK